MPKPEVKSQLMSVDLSGRVWSGSRMLPGDHWIRINPDGTWQFVNEGSSDLQPGELVHSARAGGTFRVSTVNEQRQVVHLEDFQGRRWPFDLDYVRSHFRRFGEVAE